MTKPNWRKWADEEPKKDKGQVSIKMGDIYMMIHFFAQEWCLTGNGADVSKYLDFNIIDWCYADEVFGEE